MSLAFDTLKFTQRLEQVGVGREQAVAHAEPARDMILADVATKVDLTAMETALRTDLASMEKGHRQLAAGAGAADDREARGDHRGASEILLIDGPRPWRRRRHWNLGLC